MNDYNNKHNFLFLNKACEKMLNDKFRIKLTKDKLQNIIYQVSNNILEYYKDDNLQLKELNNITLSKIKEKFYAENYNENDSENQKEKDILDQDLIDHKLKELELRRQIIPNFSQENSNTNILPSNTSTSNNSSTPITPVTPISINVPNNLQYRESYKTFIINSLNRDWDKNPFRNNIKFNMAIDTSMNEFYIHCICFPKFVKNMTPYVLMSITDGNKTLYFSFTCTNCCNKWDTWSTIDKAENISLTNKQWSIKFFDFTNNELNLGQDGQAITEVLNIDNTFHLKLCNTPGNTLDIDDLINIKTYHGQFLFKKICGLNFNNDDSISIVDESSELTSSDFVNSKILNATNQYSIIIKYKYKGK